jgi:Glycosyltransferase family 87
VTRVDAVRTAGAWAAAAALGGLVWWAVRPSGEATPAARTLVQVAAWVVFAAGVWLVRRLPVRRAVLVIVIGGIGMQVAALSAPPRTSTDAYRYVWDGRVQAAGIDPYRYVPAASELAGLRDPDFLWARAGRAWCVAPGTPDPDRAGAVLAPGCTLINRPAVHTIYPPVAEGYFTAVHALSPPGARIKPMQVAAALAAGATTLLLVTGLRRLGRDPRLAAYWALCPMVALEAGNNAHVDVVAAGLTVLALVTLAGTGRSSGGRSGRGRSGSGPGRARALLGGGVLGLAIATKLFPALILPAAARRRPVAIAGAALGAVGAVYLPHVLAVGGGVLGYLPGYLKEEEYDSGSRFAPCRGMGCSSSCWSRSTEGRNGWPPGPPAT